jgi:hypothetical protein
VEINIKLDGLFKPNIFDAFKKDLNKELHRATAIGMEQGAKEIKAKVRENINSSLKVKKKSFSNLLTSKVHKQQITKLPLVHFYSREHWLYTHEDGARITGKKGLLIPLLDKRISMKKMRELIDNLNRQGNIFFKEHNGKVLVFAENIKENTRDLTAFKRQMRKTTGKKSIKKGEDVLIAVFVKSVKVRKRINAKNIINKNIDTILNKIEQNINLK